MGFACPTVRSVAGRALRCLFQQNRHAFAVERVTADTTVRKAFELVLPEDADTLAAVATAFAARLNPDRELVVEVPLPSVGHSNSHLDLVQDFADATSGDGSSDDPGREGPLDAHQVEQLLRNLVPDVETLARYIAQRAKALHDEPAPLGKPHAPDAPVVFIARRLNAFFKRRAGRPAHAAVAAITAAWCDQEVSEARVKELVKARGPKVQGKGNLRA